MRVPRPLLAALVVVSLGIALIGILSYKYVRLYFARISTPDPSAARISPGQLNSNDPDVLRLSWLFNWPKAGPLYSRAEALFKAKGDKRNEIYARVGHLRSQSETMSFVDLSQMIQKELDQPETKTDPQLRLWVLAQKGYTDLEINVASAKRAWLEARTLAKSLGETQWEARAEGELGTITFLEGNSKQASIMVGDALLSAMASGDLGGQVRTLEMLGNGFNEVRRYGEALAFFDRAITTSRKNPDCGFPYMAYEGKGLTLAGEGKLDEANQALDYALGIARQNDNTDTNPRFS